LVHIKESFSHWIDVFKGKGWNTIYWHNHDMPRIISHYGNDSKYHNRSGKMLLYTLYFLPGTPIVYYGEEIGMTNVDYEHLDDFKDVEVFTEYQNFMKNGASHEVAMQALRDRSRDNARSPMQWSFKDYAGFSEVKPWMKVNKNHKEINVLNQEKNPDSLFNAYKEILHLRKEEELAYGDCQFIDLKDEDIFAYETTGKTYDYLIIANFTSKLVEHDIEIDDSYQPYLTNIETFNIETKNLKAYETRIYRRKR
jgi:glycosidase